MNQADYPTWQKLLSEIAEDPKAREAIQSMLVELINEAGTRNLRITYE